MPYLNDIIPTAEGLLEIEPEELGFILLGLFSSHAQHERVTVGAYHSAVYPTSGQTPAYNPQLNRQVHAAIAEAFAALENFGLIVEDQSQGGPTFFRRLTRRGRRALEQQRDLSSFKKAHLLPLDLLQPELIETAYPLFLRGDYDTAVFSAFKELEIAVRAATERRGTRIADNVGSVDVMRTAFNVQNGPLTNMNVVAAEREAEGHLFAGAMGHARNPPGHRDVDLSTLQAARLIAFASHLLSIVDERAPR